MKSVEEVEMWVLDAINRELELQFLKQLIVIDFNLEDLISKDLDSPTISDSRKVIYLLEKKYKLIEITEIDNLKERKAHQKYGLDYSPSRETATSFVFKISNRQKFDDLYHKFKEKTPATSNVLSCRNLVLNLTQGTVKYGEKDPIEISPNMDEVKFLALLMSNDRIVKYDEIADKLDMTAQVTGRDQMIKSVQYLRRDIVPILENAGMTRKAIQDMIISKRNVGYKLNR